MPFLRLLLIPFSWLYGIITWLRNFFYDKGLLKSTSFPLPIIAVGNLTTGGTGKTPHIEYLIRLLKGKYKTATLSRGYGRKNKGFMIAPDISSTSMIGDEPMQYHSKFPDVIVSVGEDRAKAIENLLLSRNRPDVILMDDAFQHRGVKPGLNILLIEYDSVFKQNYLLPAGSLREWKMGIKRADIIIISKSPEILVPIERKRVSDAFHLLPHQQLFFSYLKYGDFVRLGARQNNLFMSGNYYFEKRFTILLVTGIANPQPMMEYLRRKTEKLETLFFPDHHQFTKDDIRNIRDAFNNISFANKIIVTTEKDSMRLQNAEIIEEVYSLPVFYLPIEVAFHHQDKEKFDNLILNYAK